MSSHNLDQIVQLMQQEGIKTVTIQGGQVECVYEKEEEQKKSTDEALVINPPDPANLLSSDSSKRSESEMYWRPVIERNLGQIQQGLRRGAIAKYLIATICLLTGMNFKEVPHLYTGFLRLRADVLASRSEAYKSFKPNAVEVLRYYGRQIQEGIEGDYLLFGDIEDYIEHWKIEKDNEQIRKKRSLSFLNPSNVEPLTDFTQSREITRQKLQAIQQEKRELSVS